MNALLRPFRFVSWPIWAKFLAGFALAVIVPALVVGVIVHGAFQDINRRYIENYVMESGRRQAEAINQTFNRASAALLDFAANPGFTRQINLSNPRPESTAALLQATMFRSGLYLKARILDADGRVIVQSGPDVLLPAAAGEADSLTFQRARQALEQGRAATLTVLPDGTLEMTQAINDVRDQPGYLIATLDSSQVVGAFLPLSGNVYQAYTYLVTAGDAPVVFSLPETRAAAEQSAASAAAARALTGSSGVIEYRIGAERQTPVIGYYAPIFDPTLAGSVLLGLVTEVNAGALMNQTIGYFSGARAFVLAVGPAALLALLALLFYQLFAPPIEQVRQAIQAMTRGDFKAPVTVADRGDEIGGLATAFLDLRAQVRGLLDDLEARLAARARDISATQAVSRFAATQRDLQTLMDEVVNLIVINFPDIYHAQIFLVDADRQYALLRASTGEAGQMLLRRGHRLAVGSVSVIGQVTQLGQVVVARDTAASPVHRRNEYLPDTRAELAIPLQIGDRVIGALDVQSKQAGAFRPDEIAILQTLADQIAAALENARLYQELTRRMADIERINRDATRTAWQDYIYSQRMRSLASTAGVLTGSDLSDLRRRAIAEARVVVGQVTSYGTVPVAVPIQISGQPLGAVEWELPAELVNENQLLLAQELASRLAVSLDNARLFEESQRAAERERIVNAIAGKLTSQTEIAFILQTAAREVGQALRAPRVQIRLHHANGDADTSER